MPAIAPELPRDCPRRITLVHQGRNWPLLLESDGWRLRTRTATVQANFRTGSYNLEEAKKRAKDHLDQRAKDPLISRKGGGTLAALAAIYEASPKRTKDKVAKNNVARLKVICRMVLGRELEEVTCKEIGPDFWQAYQRAALEARGIEFDLTTRRRENHAINSATRAARCLFLPAMLPYYRKAGLVLNPDAAVMTILPLPYLPPSAVDVDALGQSWGNLRGNDDRLWLTIGLARFAGLRREEINACRGDWIEEKGKALFIALRDRPEQEFWTKTGKPYRAQVISPDLVEWLKAAKEKPDELVVPDPTDGSDRDRWFERVPQVWLHAQGITARKPLHRLRGIYADNVREITEDAVAARLAGVKAAQEALGHTSSKTTENAYLTPDALR